MMIKMTLLAKAQSQLDDRNLPVFVYFEKIIRENTNFFLQLTREIPKRKLLYSAKAASFPFLLKTLSKKVQGFDASSVSEAELIKEVLGNKSNLYITSPAMAKEEIKRALKLKPKFVHLDSLSSLDRFLKTKHSTPIGIRINPGIGYSRSKWYRAGGKESRLGINLKDLKTALEICKKNGIKEIGLHFHICCQAKTLELHTKALQLLSKKISGISSNKIKISHVNLGGGIMPPTWDFEKDKLVLPKIPKESVEMLSKETKQFIERHKNILLPSFSFIFEPGDFLVGSAAVLIARAIEARRDATGAKHVILNTNVSHFPNLLQYNRLPSLIYPKQDKEGELIKLSGNSCFGGDQIRTARIKDPDKVKRVVFGDRGSYEFCELNFFNGRLRPNVAFVDEKGMLDMVKEDSFKDLAGYWKERTPSFPKKHEAFPNYESIAIRTKGLCLYHPKLKYISAFDLDNKTFPIPNKIKEAFFNGFKDYYNQYGRTLGCPELRQRIADYENVCISQKEFYSKENAVATLGAANAFWLLLQSIMKTGLSSLLIHSPSYYQFTKAAKVLKIRWEYIQKQVNLEEISNKIVVDASQVVPQYQEITEALENNPDTRMVVVSDPGFPYATRLPNGQLKKLAIKARNEGWALVIDETLGEMPHYKEKTNLDWIRHSMPVARIKSFSKTFGLSGMRSGYMMLTNSLKEENILGETVLEGIEKQVDIAYASPPPIQATLIIAALDVLEESRKGENQDSSVRQFEKNLSVLKQRTKWVSGLLSDYEIRHVMPEYAYTMMTFLEKLGPYPKNNFHFFESLMKKHKIWIELGGIFLQNPEWEFTTARIGLGRKKGDFEKDLKTFCKFYEKYRG